MHIPFRSSRTVARVTFSAPLALALLGLSACGPPPPPAVEDTPTAALAVLRPTEGHEARGEVRFTLPPDGRGLAVEARVSGLEPGAHAFHVHLYGDCTAPDGTSAGTHFNFIGPSADPPEDIDRITGDLGELEAGEDGEARHEGTVQRATLVGPKSIAGRAVVVHARGNDPSQPPIGAAGPRVACGVIGVVAPPAPPSE